VEEQIPDTLRDGEMIIEAVYLSAESPLRAGGLQGKPLHLTGNGDDGIPGSQVGRIVKSSNTSFPEGGLVYGDFGWRDLTLFRPTQEKSWRSMYLLPDYFNKHRVPESYALGAIGMPGVIAYHAVEKVLGIQEGGTLVVSTATGAVGSMVLQIGKLKGCKTLVFTSTDDKVIWLKTLGAGYIFNYNKVHPPQVFREYAKEGIDFYFDNIGGEFTYHVMKCMKPHGRIAVCDAVSCYASEDEGVRTVPFDYLTVVDKRIRIEGFSVCEFGEREWKEAMDQMFQWIIQGKIKVEETVLEGFDKLPQAFLGRYNAKAMGMQVVKV